MRYERTGQRPPDDAAAAAARAAMRDAWWQEQLREHEATPVKPRIMKRDGRWWVQCGCGLHRFGSMGSRGWDEALEHVAEHLTMCHQDLETAVESR